MFDGQKIFRIGNSLSQYETPVLSLFVNINCYLDYHYKVVLICRKNIAKCEEESPEGF